MSLLNEKSYALLKAAHLVVMWKKMHEVISLRVYMTPGNVSVFHVWLCTEANNRAIHRK